MERVQEAFYYDKRLGTMVLKPDIHWEDYPEAVRSKIIGHWALYCAAMTNKVAELEEQMMEKLEAMYETNDADEMHELNNQMMDLASIVCDLNILSRSIYADMAKAHF